MGARKRIAIAGAGASGTLAAIQTAIQAKEPVEIVLIEAREDRRSGGVAYGAEDAGIEHYTNIAIERMSLDQLLENKISSNDKISPYLKLEEWLNAPEIRDTWPDEIRMHYAKHQFEENNACPRVLYQLYLDDMLHAIERNAPEVQLNELSGRVNDIQSTKHLSNVSVQPIDRETGRTKETITILANETLIATGNAHVKRHPAENQALLSSARYVQDQWSETGKARMQEMAKKSKETDNIAIIGTSLSAYDAAVSLVKAGYKGHITMVSRNAHEHFIYAEENDPEHVYLENYEAVLEAKTIPEAIQALVHCYHSTLAANEDNTPEDILTTMQEHVPKMLKHFKGQEEEVRNVLKRFNSLISTLRVGVSHEIGSEIQRMKDKGRLDVVQADIQNMSAEAGFSTITMRIKEPYKDNAENLKLNGIISCLGRSYESPLVNQLMGRGDIIEHPLGLGIALDDGGKVLSGKGDKEHTPHLYALGPMCTGKVMESTGTFGPPMSAIPMIRSQAREVAKAMLKSLKKAEAIPDDKISGVERAHTRSTKERGLFT